jgi:hypothetical protein
VFRLPVFHLPEFRLPVGALPARAILLRSLGSPGPPGWLGWPGWLVPLGWLILLACATAACSDTAMDPPEPHGSLSGHVVLRGRQTDDTGAVVAEVTVPDVDGLAVLLRGGDGSRRQTPTTAGRYEFDALPPGAYVATAGADSAADVSSAPTMVTTSAVTVPGELALDSTAGVTTYPNPFRGVPGLAIEFTTRAAGPAVVEVITPAGAVAWRYTYNPVAGYQHIHWIGIDNQSQPVPNGLYWVIIRRDGHSDYSLVRKLSD